MTVISVTRQAEAGGSFYRRELRLRTHRVCDPQDASYVFRICTIDRSVLPRWHQDDRGKRGLGVHKLAPDGAYAKIRSWDGRQGWIAVVAAAAAWHPEILKANQVTAAGLNAWAQVKSGYAQLQRSGRRCIVRPATLASVLGWDPRTVERYNAAARDLGVEHVLYRGEMLNEKEKKAARGSRQMGFSTEVAFTIPAAAAAYLALATPYGVEAVDSAHNPGFVPLSGASAEMKEATASPLRTKKRRRARPARELAVGVVRMLHWLEPEDPARLEPTLTRFATCVPAWDPQDVTDMVQTVRERRGLVSALTADQIRTRPAVVLAGLLKEVNERTDHPRLAQLNPSELRCGRPECVNGWIEGVDVMLALTGRLTPIRHCDQCRPGAWPDPEPDVDAQEPPF